MISSGRVECSEQLLARARQRPPVRTAIVHAVNDVIMESVRDAVAAGLIEPILIGDRHLAERAAAEIGFDIASYPFHQAGSEEEAARIGASLAGTGQCDAVMKGHLHTDIFMRALLARDAGLRLGKPFTHVFYMTIPGRDGGLFITDAALNPAPDIETRKAIIINAVALARSLGIDHPKVALLSATEVPSPHIPSSTEAEELTAWARTAITDADIDGPLAFDLAVSPEAVRVKGVRSPVAGAADIIVVPEIVVGNALFKMMVHYTNACAGGIVLGAKVPILLTSRSDPPAARLASAALAAIAQGEGQP